VTRRAAGRADGRHCSTRPQLRAAAVLTGMVTSLLAAQPAAAAPGDGTSGDGDRPVEITVGRLEPRTVTPGSTIVLSGTLVNDGDDTFSDLAVRLQRGEVLPTRRALVADTADPSDATSATAGFLPVPGVLEPGESLAFTYTATAEELQLAEDGVYPALVNVNGTREGGETERVGELSTYLVAQPAEPTSRTTVAWLWPVTDRPHRDATGAFVDDGLAASVAPGGRLDRVVAVLEELPPGDRPVPVTLAVDPALLEELAAMAAGPYQVAGAEGTGTADAADLLDRLRALAAVHPVVALPYADVDADALVTAGLPAVLTRTLPGTDEGTARQPVGADGTATAAPAVPPDGPGDGTGDGPDGPDAAAGTGAGAEIIRAVLDVAPRTDLAWPAGGTLGTGTLATLHDGGARSVVLAEDAVTDGERAVGDLPGVAAARAELATAEGPVTALIADEALAAVVDGAERATGGPRIAEQRYLAELGVLTSQLDATRPGAPQTVLVVPPHRVDADPEWASAMIGDTATQPWLTPASLQDLAIGPLADAGELQVPAAERDLLGEEGMAAIAAAVAVRNDVAAAVSGDPASVLAGYDAAIARASSSAWRGDPPGFAAVTRDLRSTVEGLRDRVSLLAPADGTYSLASSDAPLVLTVQNDLPFAVDVRLDLRARGNVGLTTDDVGVVTLEPLSRTTVQVPAHVRQSGGFAVTAALTTPAGGPLGDPVQIQVKSTAYGSVTLAITLGAALLLGLLFLRRLVVFLRARRHGGPRAEDGMPGPADQAAVPPVRSPV
jgi:hypothetical protein